MLMYFIVSPKKSTNNLAIYIDNIELEQVQKNKFLGVIINSKLNQIDHIKTATNKLSKNIGIIFKVRHNSSSSTLLMLYRTLIQPYCKYCNVVWAAGSSHSIQTLFKKQKKAIRALVFAKFNAYTKPIFNTTHVLTIHGINKLQTAYFVYNIICYQLENSQPQYKKKF